MNFRFEPPRWSLNTNLYEVNLRQYTSEGTFHAFGRELHRLREMGIEVLWFMPITPISKAKRLGSLGSYYACSDYLNTNPEFGTIHDFKNLVKKAHDLGFKVLIDWVANHTGWDHVWTETDPGFYKRNSRNEFYDNNNWSDVIDLNYYDHAMRRKMIEAMQFWVQECEIDGFRCDMAHLVPLDFWRQARQHLDAIKPLFWLAETEHPNYQHVFDCSYAWHWMHATENFVKNHGSVEDLKHVLSEYQRKKLAQTNHLFFTSNHDENSWNGTEYEKYGAAAQVFAVFACTWNGIPMIYSGQELPNRKRLKFFDKDLIEWTGKYELQDFYKTLLHLRSSFREEQTEVLMLNTGANRHLLAFIKLSRLKQQLVVLNLGDQQQSLHLEESIISGMYRDVFTNHKLQASAVKNIHLQPWGWMVLEKR